MGHGVGHQAGEIVKDRFDWFGGLRHRTFDLGKKISGGNIRAHRAIAQSCVIVARPFGGLADQVTRSSWFMVNSPVDIPDAGCSDSVNLLNDLP